jgi:hypothetical protein
MRHGTAEQAERILAELREKLQASVGVVGVTYDGEPLWRVDLTDATGQRWVAEHPDYLASCVALAEMVGSRTEEQ